jgi:large subunit ribosomal protein L29
VKASELRSKSVNELEIEVISLLKVHFNLRVQKAMQQLGDHTQLGIVRRDIARVKTILKQVKAGAGNARIQS